MRYNVYSNYLLKKYGEKVHKLPINLPGTCPNRDGTLGWGGCVFCDEQGSGFECLPNTYPFKLQIEKAKSLSKILVDALKNCRYNYLTINLTAYGYNLINL